jgi:myo-inositol 2-dehydrogenase/D-chiro-inositol 1-dehydrogenase
MIRAGFVGTGGFARIHADALQKLGVRIAACYSATTARMAAFGEAYGAQVFPDPLAMIDPSQIDVLFIAIPPGAHDGAVELAAARQGIPFLVEKPVGLDLGLCRRIAQEVQGSKLVTAVGYINRQRSAVPVVREILSRNRLSSVRCWRQAKFAMLPWWRKTSMSGGMMVEQATHLVDLLRCLLGDIRRVSAVWSSGISQARFEGCDVFDSMEALMQFRAGLIGSIGACCTLNHGVIRVELLEAVGDDFYLSYDLERVRYKEKANDWVELPFVEDSKALIEAEDRQFLQAVADRDPAGVASSYADALKTLQVTLAMNESARTGAFVDVDRM